MAGGGRSGSGRNQGGRAQSSRVQGRQPGGARPKAPRRPTAVTYWRRRIVLLLVLVGALCALIFGLVKGSVATYEWFREQMAAAQEAQSVTAETTYPSPKACDISQIAASLSLSATEPVAGAGEEFSVTLTNNGKLACTLDGGAKQLGVLVVSGNQQIWNSVTCPVGEEGLQLLLPAGGTWTKKFTWDGRLAPAQCGGESQVANPGTYRAQVQWGGGPISPEAVFVIQPAPAPVATEQQGQNG